MPTFQIQFRRDTTANWGSCNPVLLDGELGLEIKEDGSRLFKLGDGVTAWLDLPYSSGPKGEDFKYEDFTPEQLELLRGPKGDAFKYEDFTPAQIAALKGEKGDTGDTGNTGPMPAHRWEGTTLQFQDANGEWAQAVDLKGPKGDVADGVEIEQRLTEKLNTEIEQARTALEEVVPIAGTTTPLASTATGSVGTDTKYARADHTHPAQAGVPVGTIVYFGKKDVPAGYLVCNGGSYSSTTYADLYNVIGTTFGGTTSSFKVPNLIDKVAWGNATVGTSKSAGLPNIKGYIDRGGDCGLCISNARYNGALYPHTNVSSSNILTGPTGTSYAIGFDASLSNSIYGSNTTVQPPALTLLPCIKY